MKSRLKWLAGIVVLMAVVFAVQTAAGGQTRPVAQRNVYRIDIDKDTGRARGPIRVLRRMATSPAVSPDGSSVAFLDVSKPGQSLVGVMDAATGQDRPLPDTARVPAFFTIGWRSPQVLLLTSPPGQSSSVLALDLKTGTQQAVLDFADADNFVPPYSYLPASDEIGFTFGFFRPGSRIVLRSVATGERRPLRILDRILTAVTNGRQVAYTRWTSSTQSTQVDRLDQQELRIGNVDGQDETVLTTKFTKDPSLLVFGMSPDGRYLIYYDGSQSLTLRVLNLRTRQSAPVSDAAGQPAWGSATGGLFGIASWAPDGSYVVLYGRDEVQPGGGGR